MGALAGMALGAPLLGIAFAIWEGLTGAALGKMLLKVRIKSDDGRPAGTGKLLTRAAVKYSGSLLGLLAAISGVAVIGTLGSLTGLVIFVGFFFVLGQAQQAFHDMIAKTAVYSN